MRKVLFQHATLVVAAALAIWTVCLEIAHGAPISFKVPLSGGHKCRRYFRRALRRPT